VELVVNNTSIIKHSNSSAIGRAIVGGVLFGGVGAIIGGTTGTVYSSDIVRNIAILVIIDNQSFRFDLLSGVSTPVGSELHSVLMDRGKAMCESFKILLNGAANIQRSQPIKLLTAKDFTVYDELCLPENTQWCYSYDPIGQEPICDILGYPDFPGFPPKDLKPSPIEKLIEKFGNNCVQLFNGEIHDLDSVICGSKQECIDGYNGLKEVWNKMIGYKTNIT